MVFVHIVPHAIDAGLSAIDASFVISLIGAANIPGRLVIGQFSDTFGRKALAVTCTLIHCLCLLWLLWASEPWQLFLFGIAFGFLWGGSGTVITAYIGDIFGTRSLGAIMGVISGCWAFGAAAGPALGGFLYDFSGHYLSAFALGAFSLLLAALVIIPIKKVRSTAVKT